MRSDNVDPGCTFSSDGPLSWVFKPSFGIVHQINCAICRSYMTHLIVAHQAGEPSFKDALSEREVRLCSSFLDGVREGRQLQQEHDTALSARCREERDKAVQSLERHKQLLDAAKNELDLLRDEIFALQNAFDDLSLQKDDFRRTVSHPERLGDDALSMEPLRLGSTVDLDCIDDGWMSAEEQKISESTTDSVDIMVNETRKTSQAPCSAFSPSISPASFQQQQTKSNTASASPPQQKVSTPPPTPKSTTPAPKPLSVHNSTSVPTQTTLSPRPLTTLAHLQTLMTAAHAGDDSALTRVRAFCASAHQTPRDQRTELHRYALMRWRRSRSASDANSPTPNGNVNVEIYVDASSWGVGFVMDGQWLAWKYSDSLCFPIDINWAEMLAVEVGLWTVVHWATLQEQKQGQHFSLSILIRSDNAGVVKAIEKQHSNYAPQQEVLQRILDLIDGCDSDIQLTMKWISSLENLADNPSRGVPGLGATLLPYLPPLPQHLSTILVPITSFV